MGWPCGVVLAGNKIDMERNRAVTNEDAEAYSASVDAQLFGTSAKLDRGAGGRLTSHQPPPVSAA